MLNINEPLLQLFRNGIGDEPASGAQAANRFLALRFVGGNRTAAPTTERTNRDGYGAVATLTVGGARLVREHRCGEGMSAQNSATMLVGTGPAERVDAIEVAWPSGRTTQLADVPTGSLITCYEDPEHSPSGEAFTVGPYTPVRRSASTGAMADGSEPTNDRMLLADSVASADHARLRMFTTVASWCASCKAERPALRALRDAFPAVDLAMYGVPFDGPQDVEALAAYSAEAEPGYSLLSDVTQGHVDQVKAQVQRAYDFEGLPATVVTDHDGLVLGTWLGIPTISELRRLLAPGPESSPAAPPAR